MYIFNGMGFQAFSWKIIPEEKPEDPYSDKRAIRNL
jgi:hypothetical protein